MQCKCGGDTRISDSVNKKLDAVLEFYECKACSRVSSAKLFIGDSLVADDPTARQHYAALDKALAQRLLTSPSLSESEVPTPAVPTSKVQPKPLTKPLDRQDLATYETGSLF